MEFEVKFSYSAMGTGQFYRRKGDSIGHSDVVGLLLPNLGEGARFEVTAKLISPGVRGCNPFRWRANKHYLSTGRGVAGLTLHQEGGYDRETETFWALCNKTILLGFAAGGAHKGKECQRCAKLTKEEN